MAGKINVKQIKSPIGFCKKQKEILRGLGLRKINHKRELEDTPAIRGMVNKIPHLVVLEEV